MLLVPILFIWALWRLLAAWHGVIGHGLLDWLQGIVNFVQPVVGM
jgi:hypothetical protein